MIWRVLMNKKQEEFTREFTSFIQEQGFIWGPEPEIYGGLAGFYTYGPLGKLLKNKVENNIRKVFKASDFWELEGPTVLPNIVWDASGHLGNFIYKVVICSKCNKEFRAREFTQAERLLYVDPKQKNKREKFEDVKKEKLPLWIYQIQDSKKDL